MSLAPVHTRAATAGCAGGALLPALADPRTSGACPLSAVQRAPDGAPSAAAAPGAPA